MNNTGRPALREITGKHEKRRTLSHLIPTLLDTGKANVIWDIEKEKEASRHRLRELLSHYAIHSAPFISIADPTLVRSLEAVSSVELKTERLADATALLELFSDFWDATAEAHAADPWTVEDWQALVRSCYEAFRRSTQESGRELDVQKKASLIGGQSAELLMGRALRKFSQTPLLKPELRILEGTEGGPTKFVRLGHTLEFTHASPFSCTLYAGKCALEEYDAILKNGSSFVAIDVTCMPNPNEKITKDYSLPKIREGVDVAILHMTKKNVRSYNLHKNGIHELKIPALEEITRLSEEIFVQFELGTAQDFHEAIKGHSW